MVKKGRVKSLKTFNLDDRVYGEFSEYCKKHGISMSKRIENFIKQELEKIKGGIKKIEANVKEIGIDMEHSFKKYC